VAKHVPELFQFTPEEVDIMAKMEHERWMRDLLDRDGI
jgi:hypothetical protein